MTKGKPRKVMISRRALLQRINRALQRRGEKLRAYRGAWRESEGDFYIVNVMRNSITAEHVRDVEALGRELEVLAAYEAVEEEA